MPHLSDIFDEINAIQQWQDRRRRADNAAATYTSNQVNEMRLAHRVYPDIRAGSLLALAQGNYRHDHPLVTQIAELSARLNLRDHPNGQDYGTPAISPGMSRSKARAIEEATQADYARADAQMALSPAIPADVAANPEALTAWRAADDAGLVQDGMIVDSDYNVESPQHFTWLDTLNRLSDLGVSVPVIDRAGTRIRVTHPAAEDTEATPGTAAAGRRFEMEEVAGLKPGTQEWRDAFGIQEPGGPGLIDAARQATGTQPTTPQELQVAGVTTEAITQLPRTAFQALDFGVQEIQGQVRNVYAATHGLDPDWLGPQSDLLISLSNPDLESGTGFFTDPESELASERRRREAERGTIGGHSVTLGRWVADGLSPFDPDTKPYMLFSGLVDLSVQAADPSAYVLGAGGKARQASRLFDLADANAGVRGLRAVLRPVNASHWLDSDTGIDSVTWLTHQRSPTAIWRGMNHKINMETAVALADTRTFDETRSVLEPMLGRNIREVATATVGRGRSAANPRRVMPMRGRIDAHNNDIVAFEMESYLHNAGATPGVSATIVDQVARAQTPVQINHAIREGLRTVGGLLDSAGVTDEILRAKLTNLHKDTHEAVHATVRAAMTTHGPSSTPIMVNGVAQDVLDPVLVSELAPKFISLPDPRDIRRITSRYSNLFTKGSLFSTTTADPRMGTSVLEFFQNEAWKPLQLMRAAWTIRVVGEEQLRMAAAGYDSMFRHPLSYIAGRVGTKQGIDFAEAEGVVGYANNLTDSLARTHGNWVDRGVVPTGVRTTYSLDDLARRDDYTASWGSELLRLHGDPIANHVANAESLDEAVEWFTRGGGNKFRADLAVAFPGRFDTPEQARAYIEGIQRRIDAMTGGDADLTAAVRHGKIGDQPLLAGTGLNHNVIPTLGAKADTVGPGDVLGTETISIPRSEGGRAGSWWQDAVVDRLFGMLMTNRTNNLSRSQTFRQAYIKEIERLIPTMSQEGKDEAVRIIKGLTPNEKWGVLRPSRRSVARVERGQARGALSFEEADVLAGGYALDEVKTLLYDLSRRGRFMDANRLIFPFGEAWSEVITRWMGPDGLIARNPKVVRRFQQTVQGARGEDFGEVMGAPEGQGFFWKNEFGDEVFIYPGSGLLTDKLLGVEIPLAGRVEGLSMFGTVIPGLGPALQIPAGWVLQNKPGPQFFREFLSTLETAEAPEAIPVVGGTSVKEQLLPFGSVGAEDEAEITNLLNFVPRWARTGFAWATGGAGSEEAYGNSMNAVAAYLLTTGEYGSTQSERQRLMQDAAHKSRWYFAIKAIAQGFAPSAPSEDWRVQDEDGRSLRLRALAEEYRALQRRDFETADSEFLNRYGENILAAVQPKSAGVNYSLPTTAEGVAWVVQNPEVDNLLPHTYGFFTPKGDPEDFDPSLYAAQNRHQYSLDEWTAVMNTTKGDMIYEDSRSQVEAAPGNRNDDAAFLRETREWIADNYDGWGDKAGIPSRPSTDVLIRELERALDNDAVMRTDAGRGLALYMEARAEVMADVRESGHTLGHSDFEEDRIYLNDFADWVIGQHPDFEDVFDIVLSRETEVVTEDV